ncbi:PTS sugar transporter subunit IIA [Subtercola boreus]|uniref:Ascorbate-specific PTS system EIIA component n=1 Tax=Subtercola boreus TaxID=120213 RepID=A0A3E0WEQ2_9MICO|nr:PTS sugar transporter subunit IIA [Subtercola boreus]RFA22602.1 PTS ascorbate transporter subunit IIA [Subtercola boreus]RFA22958.1 PTS ascorbate transporter subunit IIA [Subtercola boreus]RFA28709.1 PTS ascorbate transporter subunit IIA [Subtercola boreus]
MLTLPDSAILLGRDARDWRGAVLLAGEALEAAGLTEPEYGPRMVSMVEEFGAYIVIAPGLALAHARPGPDVLHSGMAVVTLAEPVVFGHPYNDPVSVVIGLAVITADEHVGGIAELANVFNDPTAIERLANAGSIADVRALFRGSE